MSYSKFKKLGVSKERYEQMLAWFDGDEESIEWIVESWDIEEVNNGYSIFDYDNTGMLEIERIDDIGAFETDEDAARQAEKDGVKLIPVEELPKYFEYRYLGWIDTPENRQAINEYSKNHRV